jgi:hypothetical protein
MQVLLVLEISYITRSEIETGTVKRGKIGHLKVLSNEHRRWAEVVSIDQ